MMKHCMTTVCFVAVAVTAVLAQQKKAAPPPAKAADEGPSLEVTMKFIQDKVYSIGQVNFISYAHSGITGQDFTAQFRLEISKPVLTGSSNCMFFFHERSVVQGELRHDKDFGIPFKDVEDIKSVEKILVMSEEQNLKEKDSANGHPEMSSRVDPPVFVVQAIRSDNYKNDLYFVDEELANRVAKAMVHAVELCGGGSKPEAF